MLNNIVTATKAVNALGLRHGILTYSARVLGKISSRAQEALTSVKLKSSVNPIFLRIGASDWYAFTQVFLSLEYNSGSETHENSLQQYYMRLLQKSIVPIIIDCGANIGLASIWFAGKYPKAKIFAIEPEPKNFAILQENIRAYNNIIPINAAISDRETRIALKNATGEAWAWETEESVSGDIPTTTVAAVAERTAKSALLIVKVDIEGSEVELFRSNTEWVDKTPLIVFESHDSGFPWRGTAHSILVALTQAKRDYIQNRENTFAFSHSCLLGPP